MGFLLRCKSRSCGVHYKYTIQEINTYKFSTKNKGNQSYYLAINVINKIKLLLLKFKNTSRLKHAHVPHDELTVNIIFSILINVNIILHSEIIYSQIDKDSAANVSLACITTEFMVVTFNSGMYIVEETTHEYNWSFPQARRTSHIFLMKVSGYSKLRYPNLNLDQAAVTDLEIPTDLFLSLNTTQCIFYVNSALGISNENLSTRNLRIPEHSKPSALYLILTKIPDSTRTPNLDIYLLFLCYHLILLQLFFFNLCQIHAFFSEEKWKFCALTMSLLFFGGRGTAIPPWFGLAISQVELDSPSHTPWEVSLTLTHRYIQGNLWTFTNLTAGTAYRFRFYRLTREGITRPEVTDWYSTSDRVFIYFVKQGYTKASTKRRHKYEKFNVADSHFGKAACNRLHFPYEFRKFVHTFRNVSTIHKCIFYLYSLVLLFKILLEIYKLKFFENVNYVPLPVRNISYLGLNATESNAYMLRAGFEVTPAEELRQFNIAKTNKYIIYFYLSIKTRSYDFIYWNENESVVHFRQEKMPTFRIKIDQLHFGTNYNLTISSFNKNKFSPQMFILFSTPTCLEYYSNLSICAPDLVEGLRAEYVSLYNELYDVKVNWDRPVYEPDNYTVEISFPEEESPPISQSVPGVSKVILVFSFMQNNFYVRGTDLFLSCYIISLFANNSSNRTEVTFSNIQLMSPFAVTIAGESVAGIGPGTEIRKTIADAGLNKFYRELIIGIASLITIIMVFGTIYLQYYKQKFQHFSVECSRFENLNQKDLPIEVTAKLLQKDYESEIGNNTLIQDKFELCPQLLKLHGVLGSGAYGVVRLGSLQDEFGNVIDVAVKMLKDNPMPEDIQNFHKEILIMKFAGQHPNIVSLIGCCTLHNMPVLVVEYCCKGDLQTYLRTIWQNMVSVAFNKARLTNNADSFTDSGIGYLSNNSGIYYLFIHRSYSGKEQNYQNMNVITNRLYEIQQDLAQYTDTITANDLLNFTRQIATGMEFLSSNRVIHRDLAARNVLVCADKIVKISDFGLSRDIYQENLYRKQGNGKLPLKWMAIEALTHQIYTTCSDVWSFGIVLWEIVTMGALPYPGVPTNAVLKLLKSGYRMERPLSCGIELYEIMLSCWHVRPQSRPTFAELKESLDKLLSYHSDTKYLNMELLCNYQDSDRMCNE
ncbi:uncharacterized protein LOC143179621 [Calliopsis andreniformis]|uniref:uncharacterized protein LOC143179621 n=1 Tax=Calliopsis andreniformis TaxID=337506 RepID=UPI003FCD766F